MSEKHRFGRFPIPGGMMRERPEKVMKIMGHCIVSDVQHNFSFNQVVYFATSPLFRETDNYTDPPLYYLTVDENDNVICQDTPFEYRRGFIVARCDLTGRTDNLFPYDFKDGDFRYRVYDPVGESDYGTVYHHCETGERIVIGEETAVTLGEPEGAE